MADAHAADNTDSSQWRVVRIFRNPKDIHNLRFGKYRIEGWLDGVASWWWGRRNSVCDTFEDAVECGRHLVRFGSQSCIHIKPAQQIGIHYVECEALTFNRREDAVAWFDRQLEDTVARRDNYYHRAQNQIQWIDTAVAGPADSHGVASLAPHQSS